jgi:copper homeostasis protein
VSQVQIIKEACVETVEEAVIAANNGAHQLELCSHLAQDGLTPSDILILETIKAVKIPVKVMIRSRAGNFIYSKDEVDHMIADILRLKAYKIEGFVFGAVLEDENETKLDIGTIYQLCKAAFPVPVTIHKAIDSCTHLNDEVKKLMIISNVKYILTSGGAKTAVEGLIHLKSMQSTAGSYIKIIAAGKVTPENLPYLIEKTGLQYYHGRKILG